MFGFDLKAVARAIVNGVAHQLARVRQGCATALMTLSEVLRPASAGRLPVAGSGTVTIPSRRSARDDAFEFPRFLAAFELMSGDQMTGLSQAAAFAPMRSPPEGPRIDVRGLLAVLFEQVEAMGASVSSKVGSCDPRVMIAVVIAATLFVRLAEANPRVSQRPAPRNTAADAIAERFAAASTDERDLSSLAERLDFAPRFRLVVREPHIENLDATPASGLVPGGGKSLPFDAQGVVIIRGLPAGARLSAGRHVMASPVSASVPRLAMLGATDWVVAQGDLDNLEVVLPPGVWPSVSATIEMIDADAISRGTMAIDVKSAAAVAASGTQSVDDESAIVPHIGHRGAASGIRTGAVGPVAPPKAVAAVTSQVRLQAKPAPRRERKKARNLRRGPPNLVKVRIQALPPVAEKPKANTLLLFKPAGAPSGKPVVASPVLAGQPPAKPLLSNPGVFPRSPMEDEAARR